GSEGGGCGVAAGPRARGRRSPDRRHRGGRSGGGHRHRRHRGERHPQGDGGAARRAHHEGPPARAPFQRAGAEGASRPQEVGGRDPAARDLPVGNWRYTPRDHREMQGTIEEGVVPGLLREIYVGRKSGTLQFLRGTERFSVRFARGTIINVQTNVTEGRLGELLQKKGLVSAHDLARAANYVVREKMRLGQALIKLGVLDMSRLEDAIALHVHDSLARVFTWNEGTYEFVEEEVK